MNQVLTYGEGIALEQRNSQHVQASNQDPNLVFSIYDNMTYPERWVADYLQNSLDLRWQRETSVFVFDEKDRLRIWTPDFFIPNIGIYIEVCGKESYNYKYRKKIYEKNQINIIFLETYQHPNKWKTHLLTRLRDIERARYTKTEDVYRNWKDEDILNKLKTRARERLLLGQRYRHAHTNKSRITDKRPMITW
jgi:hypothetical protein